MFWHHKRFSTEDRDFLVFQLPKILSFDFSQKDLRVPKESSFKRVLRDSSVGIKHRNFEVLILKLISLFPFGCLSYFLAQKIRFQDAKIVKKI